MTARSIAGNPFSVHTAEIALKWQLESGEF